MTAAADYCFNKSHAACYALIAYRTAYLKANYPAEYMAAVISSVMSTKDKVPFFVNRCEEMGIEVLPPDVNSSEHGFVVSRQLDPLRPRRGQERRPLGGRDDHRGARSRRPVRVDLGLLRAGRRARGQQARDRVPGQVRGARFDRRRPARNARDPPAGAVGGPEVAGGFAAAGRDRSSTSAVAAAAGEPPTGSLAPRHPPVPGRSSTSASCCGWRRRRWGRSSPPTRWPKCATRCGPESSGRWPPSPSSPTAPGSPSAGSSARRRRSGHARGGYVMFATLDDLEGQIELFVRDAGRAKRPR